MKVSNSVPMIEGIISAIPNRVAVLDSQGSVVVVNKAWKAFDWQNKNISNDFEWIGSNHMEAYPLPNVLSANDIFIKKIKVGVIAVLSGQQSTFHLDYPYHVGSDTVWFTINITSTDTDDGLSVLTHSDMVKDQHIENEVDGLPIPNAAINQNSATPITPWADTLNQDINRILEDSLNEIFIFDATSLQFLQLNRGGRTNLGYTLPELLQMTPVDLKPEFTKTMFLELLNPLVTGNKEKMVFKTIHRRKDGSEYPVEIHLQVSTLSGTQVFVAIVLDITESEQIKNELISVNNNLEEIVLERTAKLMINEAKLHMANEMAKIGYWEADLPSKESFKWSDDFFKLYDYEEPIAISDIDYFLQFVHDKDKERFIRLSGSAIKNNEDVQFEFRIITHKGNLKYIRTRKHFLKDESGLAYKLFTVVQDITEQKNIAIKKAKLLRMEKEMNQMKSRFVAMASHEFRTPLSTILSSTSLIGRYQKSEQQPKRDKHINRIKSSVQNLISILNDFLSLEKLESNKVEKTEKVLNFKDFLREIEEDAQLLMTGDQQLNIELGQIEEIRVDPHLLKNILFNLLSNAIKYSPEHTDVDLSCTISKGNLNLLVKDRGIGIPESEHEQMFTRFFRATNVSAIQGTGLGLTIVKRYLDLLGGNISFDSAPGIGTTFKVIIPIT